MNDVQTKIVFEGNVETLVEAVVNFVKEIRESVEASVKEIIDL